MPENINQGKSEVAWDGKSDQIKVGYGGMKNIKTSNLLPHMSYGMSLDTKTIKKNLAEQT